ncbi:Palmitoyltransferase PFA5 [Candida maltosa Xu316]|uniref:Palmitoyltransferase PFA5 n=1 Tax=Candida maltosa (strain Xu316) TaxID=1245528 RepID=M3JVK2_CANMX|nr:Palmitoyltransferase PFA5 [Candida maltosa Xu316]
MTTLDDITRNQRKRYNRWREAQNKEKKVPEWMQPSVEPRKETGRRYVNVKLGDTRVVVKYYIDSRPFDMGLKKNWINLIFNGNRNHGLDESLYTTTRFIAALVVFWVPFIDIPLCFKNRLRNKDEVEKFSNSEMLLHKYNTYSSVVNDKFMEEMDAKIKKGEYTIPKYLEPKDSDNTL